MTQCLERPPIITKAQNVNCEDQNPMHVDDGSGGMENWNKNNNLWVSTWASKWRHGYGGDGMERKQKGGEQYQASGPTKTPIRLDYGSDEQLFWVLHPYSPLDCRYVCRVHCQFRCWCSKVELVVVASIGAWRASSVGSSCLRESSSTNVIVNVTAIEFL